MTSFKSITFYLPLILLFSLFVTIASINTVHAEVGIGGNGEAVIPTGEQRAPARAYQPLVGIPGVSNAATDMGTYINQLYFLSISLAALLAVIKIIFAGVKWMLSDVVTSIAEAKKDMQGAVLGLLLIVSVFLILNTVNPNLTKLNVLSGATPLGTITTTTNNGQIQVGGRDAVALDGSGSLNANNPDSGGRLAQPEVSRYVQQCQQPTASQPAGTVTYSVRVCELNPDTKLDECRVEQRSSAGFNAVTQIVKVSCTR